MQLYILRPIKSWDPWYDRAFGFVVRARSRKRARQIASENAGDEGSAVWLDEKKTSCKLLKKDGKEGQIIRDFAGA